MFFYYLITYYNVFDPLRGVMHLLLILCTVLPAYISPVVSLLPKHRKPSFNEGSQYNRNTVTAHQRDLSNKVNMQGQAFNEASQYNRNTANAHQRGVSNRVNMQKQAL